MPASRDSQDDAALGPEASVLLESEALEYSEPASEHYVLKN